jgi:hypothetical protein
MQVARRTRRDWCRKELGRKLFVLAPIIVVVSFWWSMTNTTTSHHHHDDGINNIQVGKHSLIAKKGAAAVVTNSELMERPKVIYARVDDGADKLIVRYKAVEQAKNGSQHSISILRWAQLMAHEDVNYAQELALNLTSILKVRKI